MNKRFAAIIAVLVLACAGAGSSRSERSPVRPGITVLVEDSISVLAGKRVALLTNQTGLDANGVSDIDLLHAALPRVSGRLVALFSPEHGIRGTEDRQNIASGRDEKTGLPVHSLYTSETVPPPDSLLRDVDVLVFDLFDIGTRTWTYVGAMVYSMRAAARRGIPILVLDRPNPIGGRAEGPMLDAEIANPLDPAPGRPGRAYALYPAPLRHGLTMGELARWFNAELEIGANLRVMPVTGWRRSMWWDSTGLPWVKPSPNIPTLTSALIYPALVPFERSNVSVGRGTPTAFQRFGAPWMNARAVAESLEARTLSGVRFVEDPFTPEAPTDGKYPGKRIPGVRIDVTSRDHVQAARVGAAILWVLRKLHGDSLTINGPGFDQRMGSAGVREAILTGADPDAVIDLEVAAVAAWQRKVRPYLLY